jgi:hypothetical protein
MIYSLIPVYLYDKALRAPIDIVAAILFGVKFFTIKTKCGIP